MPNPICPICGRPAERCEDVDQDRVRCSRCGPFLITGTALALLPSRLNADRRAVARASHAIRTATSEDRWFEIDSTNIDQLVKQPLPPPERQLSLLLVWMKEEADDAPFARVDLGEAEALASIVGAADAAGVQKLLSWAKREGLLEVDVATRSASLTPKAWQQRGDQKHPEPAMRADEKPPETTEGHCPACGPERRADVVAAHTGHWEDEEHLIWGANTYNILRCRGCNTVYVQRLHTFSEDEDYERDPSTGEYHPVVRPHITYWPVPARRKHPDWLGRIKDGTLTDLLDEVYTALDTDLRVLVAIGARTALDRAMVLLGADEAAGFFEKLNSLEVQGVISQHEKNILSRLTDAGSAAAHRGWRPEPGLLNTILDGTEAFLYRTLVLGTAVEAAGEVIPRRPRRSTKQGP